MKSGLYEATDKPTIRDSGLAVFRNVEEEQSDDMTLKVKEQLGDVSGVIHRGIGREYKMAANILSARETKYSRDIGQLAVRETMDELYRSVPSLRSNQEVSIEYVKLLPTGTFQHAALILERPQIAIERQEIADVIRSMAGIAITDSIDGLRPSYTPHITVCKLPLNSPKPLMRKVSQAIENVAGDSVSLNQATFYSNGQD